MTLFFITNTLLFVNNVTRGEFQGNIAGMETWPDL